MLHQHTVSNEIVSIFFSAISCSPFISQDFLHVANLLENGSKAREGMKRMEGCSPDKIRKGVVDYNVGVCISGRRMCSPFLKLTLTLSRNISIQLIALETRYLSENV